PKPLLKPNIDLKKIVEACKQQLILHNPKADRISIAYYGELDNLTTDANIVRSILINLLSNAVKYSTEHSPINLMLRGLEDTVLIRISDQGIGIPSKEIKQVFDPFYRASNAANV